MPLWETVCIVRVTSFLLLAGGSACASRPLCRPPRSGTTSNLMGKVGRKRRVLTVKDRGFGQKKRVCIDIQFCYLTWLRLGAFGCPWACFVPRLNTLAFPFLPQVPGPVSLSEQIYFKQRACAQHLPAQGLAGDPVNHRSSVRTRRSDPMCTRVGGRDEVS